MYMKWRELVIRNHWNWIILKFEEKLITNQACKMKEKEKDLVGFLVLILKLISQGPNSFVRKSSSFCNIFYPCRKCSLESPSVDKCLYRSYSIVQILQHGPLCVYILRVLSVFQYSSHEQVARKQQQFHKISWIGTCHGTGWDGIIYCND